MCVCMCICMCTCVCVCVCVDRRVGSNAYNCSRDSLADDGGGDSGKDLCLVSLERFLRELRRAETRSVDDRPPPAGI